MNIKFIRWSLFFLCCCVFVFPKSAKAVIPPDFIFNIGSQIAQFFSMIAIFATAVFGAFFQFFKTRYYAIKRRKLVLASVVVVIIAISIGASYWYAVSKQKAEYQQWLRESEQYSAVENDDIEFAEDENDKLNIGLDNNQNIDTSNERFVVNDDVKDDSSQFISDYYQKFIWASTSLCE